MANRPKTMAELLRFRGITKTVGGVLRAKLQSHLQTMAPLFRPKRLLGAAISGPSTESPPDAERNLAELRTRYERVAPKCGLPRGLESPLPSIRVELTIHPWETPVTIASPHGPHRIRMASPTQWLLAYAGTYEPMQILESARVRSDRAEPGLREFVLNALVLDLLLERLPGLRDLLGALRFPPEIVPVPELGDLGVVRLGSPVPSVRPKDELVLEAAELSGFPTFEEIVDVDAVRQIGDPFREQLVAGLREHDAAEQRAG